MVAITTPLEARTDSGPRSIIPVIMINASPIAKIINGEAEIRIARKFLRVRKWGERALAIDIAIMRKNKGRT